MAGSMTIYERDYVDLSDWNNPNRSIPLAVGLMHTHYPLTWAKAGFRTDVGPSSTDKSPNQELPGLVYDYTNNIKSGESQRMIRQSLEGVGIRSSKTNDKITHLNIPL